MRFSRVLAAVQACYLVQNVKAVAPTDSLMDGDSSQSGYLQNHNMDPAIVGGASFGQIWAYTTPKGASEQFYAKPLVFTPSSTGRQIVLSFSEQNRIYSLDAVNGTLIATRDLGLEGETPFKVSDLGSCNDISGSVGITGTPVIDPATDTVYFWAKSYLGTDTGFQNGAYRFHAIDAVTLQERPRFPTNIQGTPADNDHTRRFTGGTVLQRPSLNLVNGVVFAGFGGHCDQYNFTGWLVGMSASSGNLLTAYATVGGAGAPRQDGTFTGGGGGAAIWMSGSAIASDQANRVFFATGNGYNTVNQQKPASGRLHLDTLSEAVVNMAVNATTGVVTQQDYFEPYTHLAMDAGDRDLGAGGVVLPDPGTFSGGGVKRLAITLGKNGIGYVMNADNLGGYKLGSGGTDAVIQTLNMPGSGSVFTNAGTYPLEGGWLYITPVGYPTLVYSLGFTSSGLPSFTLVTQTAQSSAARVGTGPATITTLKGQPGTGILWVIDTDAGLRAYNAVPVNGVMTQINLPATPSVSKFQRPAFGDGRYYISTSNGRILAYGSPVALPLTCTSPTDFGSVPIANTKTLNVTCTANIAITSLNGIVLGAKFYSASNSSLPKGALKVGATFNFPVVFDLTNHQLSGGSASSPYVAPGVQTTAINILTTNAVAGYASQQPITLTGKSVSSAPFLSIQPRMLDFGGIVVGTAAAKGGNDNTFIINNIGLSNLTILGLAYTTNSISSPNATFVNVTGATDSSGNTFTPLDHNGYFTSKTMPQPGAVIPGGESITVDANFNTNVTGTYYTILQLYSDGGNAYTILTGSAATVPVAKLEYSNGEGGWSTIPRCANPSNGCTYEIDFAPSGGLTTQTIQLRLSNVGGSALTITKSKPLEGSVLGATNPNTDFSEGLSIVPGSNELASVVFSPGAGVLNADSIFYSGQWTLNTDDLTFGVHSINFTATVFSAQVGPTTSSGSAQYKYLGCYQDYINQARLEPKEYINVNNTNGLCQTQALAAGMVFAGTEYMTQCWIGNVIPSPNLKAIEDNLCSYPCAGDSTTQCGGNGGYISIYYDSQRYFPNNGTIIGTSGMAPGIPKTLAGGWSYAGCYSDSAIARALTGAATAGPTISLDTCATFCAAYKFFGVEYADECYCSNTLASTSILYPDLQCSMNCAANQSQFCGSDSRLSLYSKNGTTLPSSSVLVLSSTLTSSRTGSSSATSTPTSIGNSSLTALGCYTDSDVTVRSLVGDATTSSSMTLEYCATYCVKFKYFGVEYGQECYCGNALASTTSLATDGRCSIPCAGNNDELCGGSYGMNVYSLKAVSTSSSISSTFVSSLTSMSVSSTVSYVNNTSTSAISTPVSSSVVSSTVSSTSSATGTSSTLTSVGCYTDDTVTARTLVGAASASGSMTLELCASNCGAFAYFGVEYADECYCGNTIAATASIATDGRCSMTCAGNSLEICGGSYGMSIYLVPAASVSSSSISSTPNSSGITFSTSLPSTFSSTSIKSTVSATPTPSIPATIGKFTYLHCHSDNVTIRTLQGKYVAAVDMTLERCAGNCTAWAYFGVEYMQECYCGSTLSYGSYIATDGRCNMKCPGNSLETCGGGNGLTLYQNITNSVSSLSVSLTSSVFSSFQSSSSVSSTSEFSSSSTLLTSSSSSDVPTSSSSQISSTIILFTSASSAFLSNSIPTTSSTNTSLSSSLSSTSSSMISSSSSTTSMSSSVLSSVTSQSSSSTTTILSNSTISTSAFAKASANPWVYYGCANDTTTARALTGGNVQNTTAMTIDMCQAYCTANFYPLAGVEYGSECYCATALGHNSTIGNSGCTMACPGNKNQTCGGSSRLSVWNNTAYIPPSIPQTIGAYHYKGCYTELPTGRAMGTLGLTNTTGMTVEMCVGVCFAKGTPLAAVEYGSQCFCGSSISSSSSVVADSQCQAIRCPGNATEYCSAGSRLQMYST